MNRFNKALREASNAAEQNPREAIRILESALSDARTASDGAAIAALSRHAGLLAHAAGDDAAAAAYYHEALAVDPESAFSHLALVDVLVALGRRSEAKQALNRAAELGERAGDKEIAELVVRTRTRLGLTG